MWCGSESHHVELKGKVAIVTGGAVRLGRAMAEGLAKNGMKVCIHYGSSAADAADSVAAINDHGGEATCVQADLRDAVPASKKIVTHSLDHFGTVDVLVNSAAIFECNDLELATEDSWDRHFSINLKAPFFLSQAFANQLDGDEAHIVNIADWRAIRPTTQHMIYTMTKSSLVTMTKMLAQHLAPRVQVNAIALGAILPPPDAGQDYLDRIAEQIPLRRTGSPDDVVSSLLFLLQSDFITGEVLRITGGEEL